MNRSHIPRNKNYRQHQEKSNGKPHPEAKIFSVELIQPIIAKSQNTGNEEENILDKKDGHQIENPKDFDSLANL